MKKLFTLIVIIAWAFNANGQIVRDSTYLADSVENQRNIQSAGNCYGCLVGIEGTDAIGNKDTIYFGADTAATVGLDSRLAEIDITGRPLKPMDMRFFQRDEICMDNIRIGDSVPRSSPTFLRYRQSLELKKDFRRTWERFGMRQVDTYTASSNKYVFKVSTQNYPISFRLIQKTGSNQYRDLRNVHFYEFRNCRLASLVKTLSQVEILDTIKYDYQSSHYAVFGEIFILNSAKKKSKIKLNIYPNPASDKIQITGLRSATNISITTIAGKEITNVVVNPVNPEVNIEDLEMGIYILHCQSKEGVQALRIVKQ